MKTVKVSEATNKQLDWLVTGIDLSNEPRPKAWVLDYHARGEYSHGYTALWEVGGPVIDDYRIMFMSEVDGVTGEILGIRAYFAEQGLSGPTGLGDTHLQAAMRAVVVRFCGDTAGVPEGI